MVAEEGIRNGLRGVMDPESGLVANMSAVEWPDCGRKIEISGPGAADEMA
jgi:hypothetical protein